MKFQDPTLYTQTRYSLVPLSTAVEVNDSGACVTGELEEAMSALGDVTFVSA